MCAKNDFMSYATVNKVNNVSNDPPPPFIGSVCFTGLMCRHQRAAADRTQTACQTCTQARKHCQFYCWHCCHWHRHCVNGFPDSPVCISVSQLRCGDFLTLIAPLSCVHIAWHIACRVKHVEQCYGEQDTWGLYENAGGGLKLRLKESKTGWTITAPSVWDFWGLHLILTFGSLKDYEWN